MPIILLAVFLALMASVAFTGASALAKTATLTFPVLQVLFIRQIVVVTTTLPAIVSRFPESVTTNRPALHTLRVTGAFVSLAGDIWAVTVLPLATATALSFTKVLLAVVFAGAFLGEPLRWPAAVAVLIGFLGVLLIIQPAFGAEHAWFYAIPLVGALGACAAVLSVRALSRTESNATLLFYQGVSVGVMSAVPMPWLWVTPDLPDLILLVSIAVCSTIGQWTSVQAVRMCEISVVGPIEYTRAVFAILFGWLFFQEMPTAAALTGTVLIILACVSATASRKDTSSPQKIQDKTDC
ncbi:MAG: DMT family transporter [Pseudomonadota bacterium]